MKLLLSYYPSDDTDTQFVRRSQAQNCLEIMSLQHLERLVLLGLLGGRGGGGGGWGRGWRRQERVCRRCAAHYRGLEWDWALVRVEAIKEIWQRVASLAGSVLSSLFSGGQLERKVIIGHDRPDITISHLSNNQSSLTLLPAQGRLLILRKRDSGSWTFPSPCWGSGLVRSPPGAPGSCERSSGNCHSDCCCCQ